MRRQIQTLENISILSKLEYRFNEEVWRVYYEDQFDAFEGNVAIPTNEFPESAKLGYYNAKKHWDKLVRNAEINR